MDFFQRSTADVKSSGWHDPQAHEEEPSDLEAGIRVQNLTKSYEPVNIFCLYVHYMQTLKSADFSL